MAADPFYAPRDATAKRLSVLDSFWRRLRLHRLRLRPGRLEGTAAFSTRLTDLTTRTFNGGCSSSPDSTVGELEHVELHHASSVD
jgi:hypothetical protein